VDRFDLEDAIMAAWQTENDLGLFVEQYYDGSKRMSEDDVANVLIGLKELHSLRMNKLWDTFTKTYKLDNHAAESAEIQTQNSEWIEDGYGSIWRKCGEKDCGKFVVKIGKYDCFKDDCPERGITT
jgi:hypothetical protein